MTKFPLRILAAGALALGAAACGSSSTHSSTTTPSASTPATSAQTAPATGGAAPTTGTTPTAGGQTIAIMAMSNGQLMFDHTALKAKAGKVTIAFTNRAPEQHNFTLTLNGKTIAATPTFSGGTKSITATLKPGTYTYFCSVPGHEAAGMKGTLTVS